MVQAVVPYQQASLFDVAELPPVRFPIPVPPPAAPPVPVQPTAGCPAIEPEPPSAPVPVAPVLRRLRTPRRLNPRRLPGPEDVLQLDGDEDTREWRLTGTMHAGGLMLLLVPYDLPEAERQAAGRHVARLEEAKVVAVASK